MTLITCRECGHQVSDQAAACPSCGAPVVVGAKPLFPPAAVKQPASAGKVIAWTLGLLIGVPVVLFVGSAVIAGIVDAGSKRDSAAQPAKPYTGRMRVDSGTEFVMLEQPTTLAGACSGWNAVSLQRPGGADAMTNLMCWRRDGDQITVTTEKGDVRKTHPASMLTD